MLVMHTKCAVCKNDVVSFTDNGVAMINPCQHCLRDVAEISEEMNTVLVRINLPHGKIDWSYIICGWRNKIRTLAVRWNINFKPITEAKYGNCSDCGKNIFDDHCDVGGWNGTGKCTMWEKRS